MVKSYHSENHVVSLKLLGNCSQNVPIISLVSQRVILASGSPRRRELLGMLDIDFRVDTSHPVDETVPAGLQAEEVAPYLSRLKAEAYPLSADEKKLVITADTVVIIDGEVLGKPVDEADARRMLGCLQGRTQKVITGVTVMSSIPSSSRRRGEPLARITS